MIAAFLFNSDHPKYECVYGPKIRNLILKNNVLQGCGRNMKVSVGDVLIPLNFSSIEELIRFSDAIYLYHSWNHLNETSLRDAYSKCTIFSWVIQNITESTALELHQYLLKDNSYLGVHGVDFSYPGHLALYRNSMIPLYRIVGTTCYLYERWGDDPEYKKDNQEEKELYKLGFKEVKWENIGAAHTILDDFDTLDHFKQVKDFEEVITPYLDDKDEGACELSMLIEDANPKLFDSLGASARALSRAVNEEDFAHVGLSIRRFIESLADTVFPPQEEKYNGRAVGKATFKNRIWAYIYNILKDDSDRAKSLGLELDRLLDEANAAVHGECDKQRVITCLTDLSRFTLTLLNLIPIGSINPNFPYSKRIIEFMMEVLNGSKEKQPDNIHSL